MADYTKDDIEQAIENLAIQCDFINNPYVKPLALAEPKDCDIAVTALREYLDRHYPQPLTLDELKQMEGQPVWIKFNDNDIDLMLHTSMLQFLNFGNEWPNDLAEDYYGKTWTAYRYEPKEEKLDE